jgi:predicted nucleic acid-binding protein
LRRALLDTDVVLDVLLTRQPFFEAAARLWRAHEQGLFQGSIAAITPLNVAYVIRRAYDQTTAIAAVDGMLMTFGICPARHGRGGGIRGPGNGPAARAAR